MPAPVGCGGGWGGWLLFWGGCGGVGVWVLVSSLLVGIFFAKKLHENEKNWTERIATP